MELIYDNLFAAVIAATNSRERSQAVKQYRRRAAHTKYDDGTESYVMCSHNFTLVIMGNSQGKWGYTWVWTDTASK